MIEEFCAGIIPFDFRKKKVFLVQHAKGDHWGFAKGHIHEGESALHAAKRELYEEAGLRVAHRASDQEFHESYQFELDGSPITKRVTYFVFGVQSASFDIDQDEIRDGGWYSVDEALKLLTFDESRSILMKVVGLLQKELEL